MISYVFLGGCLGAFSRAWISHWLNKYDFPWGTWLVNVVGSLLLGIILGIDIQQQWVHILGIGFCGAFTTFSTFSLETIKLIEQREWASAFLYLTASVGLSLIIVMSVFYFLQI
ncbi:fluoride efflux transporter CrcB [Virgibacillus sp. MSP4-1]|uniref:fluoride efflux transporter CrcB n=1 Tax=Virgibacillus sp. MSP4-1 TaxID=2700081 RepID=UPI0005C459E4|nr:fluoride efflux transporter CrcB [Virgibacillus sp. MSP4-1]QHS23163.1 fluoride efflux transporter CrcB [Virgibacillus sp. MSP4-1]